MEGLKKYEYLHFTDPENTGINETWLSYFMNIARVVSSKSKDPSTKVGAIAVDTTTKRILATGYNGFPPRVSDREERLNTREVRYIYTVHAEANCIAAAARFGIPLTGSTLFATLHPCAECTKLIAAAGIKNVVYIDTELKPQADRTWIKVLEHAKAIFQEAGIGLYACREVQEKNVITQQDQPERHKTWKGCVDKWEDLSTKRNVQLGDLIFVKHNSTLYEWNGVIWVVIGEYTHIV